MAIKKVLLVDDSKPFNFLSSLFIKQHVAGCKVDEALDGKLALDYIKNTHECPDVIFLDINMPVMDGFQFLEEYEKLDKCKEHTRIYMLTSSLREEDRKLSLKNKMVKGYFDKPITTKQLAEIIESV